MSKILILDAGHGGHDPGAQSGGLREKDLTLDIVKRIVKKLKKYDVKIITTRDTDKFISLNERANIANRNKADLFVSVHINAGGAKGYETFIYNGNVSNNTHKLQNNIHDEVMSNLNVLNRGKKRANFAVVRQTNMPAILTENLFIDGDNKLLKQDLILNKIAQGHAEGIAKYLGLKKGNATTSKPKPSKPSKPSNKDNLGLVDYMKDKKMDSSYNNRKKLAGQYGIKNYKGTAAQNTKLLSLIKKGKPQQESSGSSTKSGDTVTLKKSASKFTTGETIASHAKGKKYEIHQTKSNQVLLKSGGSYLGWVKKSDVSGGGGPLSSSSNTTSLSVGNTVTLKKSASKFATGQSIAAHAKGKKYKILQVKSDRVLLDDIMSWVKKSDVQ